MTPPWFLPIRFSISWASGWATRHLLLGVLLASKALAAGHAFASTSDDSFMGALDARHDQRSVAVVHALPPVTPTMRATLDASRETPRSAAEIWAARQWHNDMEPRLGRFVKDAQQRSHLLHRIYHEATLARLPPELVLAVIQVESAFKADAVSSAGAVGLMQIMPFWIRELGLPADDLKDPNRNLRYGCTILAHYLAVEDGDLTRALARYNGSLGKTWYSERVMHAWQRHWRQPVTGGERATVQR